jgi:hypothetical protein
LRNIAAQSLLLMLRFFRFNDPYRLLFVFGIILVLGIKTELEFPAITTPELKGILVGEMMADGKRLYTEVWDSMPPLTAYIQYIFDLVFDRSTLPRHILSWLIIAFQAAFFGILLINNRAFNESNYLPSLLFSVLAFFSFDTVSFTREILGSTLLLLAINNLLKEVEFKRQRDETMHNLGLYLGLATLCVFSYVIFFVGVVVLLFLFTRVDPRRFLLFLFGFLLPHMLLNTWYFWHGELTYLWTNFYSANVEWNPVALIPTRSLLWLTGLPFIYLLFSLIMMRRDARLTKYQSQIFQVMFFWLIFGLIEIFFSRYRTPQVMLVCVPPIVYFINHYLLLINRKWIAETMLWIFVVGILTTASLAVRNKWVPVDYSKLFVTTSHVTESGKKIMVLADDLTPFLQNKPAGIFLEWSLAEPVLRDPQYYQHVLAVAVAFQKGAPDLVIDPENKLEAFLPFLPDIQKKYRRAGNVWQKVNE